MAVLREPPPVLAHIARTQLRKLDDFPLEVHQKGAHTDSPVQPLPAPPFAPRRYPWPPRFAVSGIPTAFSAASQSAYRFVSER